VPLIENEMKNIDAELENGEKNLKWKSPNIDEYINNIRLKVSDLETRLQKSKIIDLIKENKTLLKVADENSDMWKVYTAYADKMVLDGFHKIVQTSLNYFLKETDYIKANPDPLFEAQLQLKPPEILFNPSLNYGEKDGFYEQIEGLIENVYKQGSLIPRIAGHLEQDNYKVTIT